MSREIRQTATLSAAQADQAKATEIGETLQARASGYAREVDPQVLAHERLQYRLNRIARDAPSVRMAWVALDQHGLHPVPIDQELKPTAEPLTDVEAILAHWADRPSDRIGFQTGPHPMRDWSYVAVAVDLFGTWKDWLREAASVTVKVRDLGGFADLGDTPEIGPAKEKKTYRDLGPGFARLTWAPPPLPSMKMWKVDAAGGELFRHMETQKAGRGGWIWFAVAGDVTVKKPRQIAPGLRLLATGTVVPWDGARTADGWKVTLQSPARSHDGLKPSTGAPVAPWLLNKILGKK